MPLSNRVQFPIFVVTVDVDGDRNWFPVGENKGMRVSEVGGFAFERLDVYQRAIEFLVVVARIIAELPAIPRDRRW
jgi:hypothetical protein